MRFQSHEQTRQQKAELRKKLLSRRKAMAAAEVASRSRQAQELLLQSPAWRRADVVLLYAACRNELQTDLLLQDLWERGCVALLPRCCRSVSEGAQQCDKGELTGDLELARVHSWEQTETGAFGIREPAQQTCPPIMEGAVDLALLPGVAFDIRGGRLGYGGGYYDRLLASGRLDRALLLGLGYHWQVLEQVPREPWDKPVQGLCTDKELLWI